MLWTNIKKKKTNKLFLFYLKSVVLNLMKKMFIMMENAIFCWLPVLLFFLSWELQSYIKFDVCINSIMFQ